PIGRSSCQFQRTGFITGGTEPLPQKNGEFPLGLWMTARGGELQQTDSHCEVVRHTLPAHVGARQNHEIASPASASSPAIEAQDSLWQCPAVWHRSASSFVVKHVSIA